MSNKATLSSTILGITYRVFSNVPTLNPKSLATIRTNWSARLLVYNAAYKKDIGQDASKDASMAKYFAAEVAEEIVSNALQIHGGYGYTKDYTIGFRLAKSN